MSDTQRDEIRYARRLIIRRPGLADEHGIEFPSGRILADHPERGLTAYLAAEFATEGEPDARLEYCPDDPPASPATPGACGHRSSEGHLCGVEAGHLGYHRNVRDGGFEWTSWVGEHPTVDEEQRP